MFCVECGKEGPIFRNGVCVECFLKSNSFTKGPEILDITTCAHCSSFKHKSIWTSDILSDFLKRVVKEKFNISKELKKIDINLDCKEAKDGYECRVFISGILDGVEINEEHLLTVRLKKTVCDVCSKRFGGYHEAIIQVRAEERNLDEEELADIQQFVENQVELLKSKGNNTLFITDFGKEHGGLDFFLSDKNAAFIIAKSVLGRLGGTLKQSSSNIGMKDGRQTYRNTYLVRIPSIRKNDFIKLENKHFMVKQVHSDKVKIINLSDWGKVSIDLKNIKNAKILGGEELAKEMIVVSQTESEIQVMDEKSFVIKTIKKPSQKTFSSEKIKTIKIEDQVFLVP